MVPTSLNKNSTLLKRGFNLNVIEVLLYHAVYFILNFLAYFVHYERQVTVSHLGLHKNNPFYVHTEIIIARLLKNSNEFS